MAKAYFRSVQLPKQRPSLWYMLFTGVASNQYRIGDEICELRLTRLHVGRVGTGTVFHRDRRFGPDRAAKECGYAEACP
jgi:hypothetical protein